MFHVLSPHNPDCVFLLNEALSRNSKPFFFRPELSRGTTIAAKFGQVLLDLKRSSESSFSRTIVAMVWDRIHDLTISE